MPIRFKFKSYAWSLGSTSFRMADFHRKIEEQLSLINEFWSERENITWDKETQKEYYNFLYNKGFVTGKITKDDDKAKTAREKTSGLTDIGLIDDDRKLTEVGEKLLEIVNSGDFSPDNEFQISKDSFIYLKQLIKTSCRVESGNVRPFLITGKILSECDNYLSDDEFTYLLPLCTNQEITSTIIEEIKKCRRGEKDIDDIIISTVLSRYDYPNALSYFLASQHNGQDMEIIGMNRDGKGKERFYADLYKILKEIYLDQDSTKIEDLYEATEKLSTTVASSWRKLLFNNSKRLSEGLRPNRFNTASSVSNFDKIFFNYLHLIKIKTLLDDYKDLNRRYLKVSEAFLFEDSKIIFTPIFESFFKGAAKGIFNDAYQISPLLTQELTMEQINHCLVFDATTIVSEFNRSKGKNLTSIDELYQYVDNDRCRRFKHLIDTKFSNEVILSLLSKFETRDCDKELINIAGGEADVPTIFEYIIGIIWYRLSEYQGNILNYMKLSLDSDLLPLTHACGGESDIVYEYPATSTYPQHTLLIECTLMQGTTARHGEMEPVSRHLANCMIDKDPNAYCTYISNQIHCSLLSDFLMRKYGPWYRSETESVEKMKIIPLNTQELKILVEKNIKYSQIYTMFKNAFESDIKIPPKWYKECIQEPINSFDEHTEN